MRGMEDRRIRSHLMFYLRYVEDLHTTLGRRRQISADAFAATLKIMHLVRDEANREPAAAP
jgi:hypothetical protein